MVRHQIVTIDAPDTVPTINLEQDDNRLARHAQNAAASQPHSRPAQPHQRGMNQSRRGRRFIYLADGLTLRKRLTYRTICGRESSGLPQLVTLYFEWRREVGSGSRVLWEIQSHRAGNHGNDKRSTHAEGCARTAEGQEGQTVIPTEPVRPGLAPQFLAGVADPRSCRRRDRCRCRAIQNRGAVMRVVS